MLVFDRYLKMVPLHLTLLRRHREQAIELLAIFAGSFFSSFPPFNVPLASSSALVPGLGTVDEMLTWCWFGEVG
jgi:hypothetical protein